MARFFYGCKRKMRYYQIPYKFSALLSHCFFPIKGRNRLPDIVERISDLNDTTNKKGDLKYRLQSPFIKVIKAIISQ